jgi:hypothetical protein
MVQTIMRFIDLFFKIYLLKIANSQNKYANLEHKNQVQTRCKMRVLCYQRQKNENLYHDGYEMESHLWLKINISQALMYIMEK